MIYDFALEQSLTIAFRQYCSFASLQRACGNIHRAEVQVMWKTNSPSKRQEPMQHSPSAVARICQNKVKVNNELS